MADENKQQKEETLSQRNEKRSLVDRLSEMAFYGGVKGFAKGVVVGAVVGGSFVGANYLIDTPFDTFMYVVTGISSVSAGAIEFVYESQKERARYLSARLQQALKVGNFREYAGQNYHSKLEEKFV